MQVVLATFAMKDIYFVLGKLAGQNRHVLSTWRAHLILRQEVDSFYDESKAQRVAERLRREGLVEVIKGKTLYKVTSPYARKSVNIYELANEAYPFGILSHSSALEVHQLTDQRSKRIHLYEGPSAPGEVLRRTDSENSETLVPPGTEPEDWRMHPLPRSARVEEWDGYEITTHRLKEEWFFGHEVARANGVEVQCTDVERTLIDGLRHPGYCGGMNEVFRGWVRADPSPERLVRYTEQFDQLILYQRVGFVMNTLGIEHPELAQWKEEKTPRGGSRVLNPERDFESEYSEEWNLSINHPTAILTERDVSYS
jgi:predicted transcriptional regulator of viral defense system